MTNLTLNNLLSDLNYLRFHGRDSGVLTGVSIDSRKVQGGFAFIAVSGTKVDGYDYVSEAIRKGATVIVSERPSEDKLPDGVEAWVEVTDSRYAAAQCAEWFYDYPSRKLTLVGVTGTNGKSSVVNMLFQVFEKLGYKTGMFSTISNRNHLAEMPAELTTPDSVSLSRDLAEMVDSGCDYAFMEVSSHALDQKRVSALDFDGGVFTNITHDHLDYHKTFKNYLHAKKLFFDHLKPEAFALINVDDRNASYMIQNTSARVKTYALQSMSDYRAKIMEMDMGAMKLLMDNQELITRVTGRFNAYNMLAVFGVADQLEMKREEVLLALSVLGEVPGRLQRVVVAPEGPVGIVDYAHTPDAVQKVTQAVSEMIAGVGRTIIALGCGGNRDKEKRPAMAKAAAQNADIVILTSDNPRDEDPLQIIADMYEPLSPVLKAHTFQIPDRREAIKMAVSMAQPSDVVIVAGKGHEKYQEIGGKKHAFNDFIELKEALSQRIKT